MAKTYNFIYSKLVDGPDDVVGLIAYGIYKRHKISFIEDFKKKNNDNDPGDDELVTLHDTWCQHIELYRLEAEQKLMSAHDTLYSDQLVKMEKNYQDSLDKTTINARLEASRGNFKSNFLAGLASGLVVLAFLGILSLAFFGFNFDWSKPAKAQVHAIQEQETAPPTAPPILKQTPRE